jgi:hypothetical protein
MQSPDRCNKTVTEFKEAIQKLSDYSKTFIGANYK